MAPAKRPATYADLEALPAHLVGEILDGELIVSPRPRSPHTNTEGGVHADLLGPFQRGRGGPGGWWIQLEPELHLAHHVIIPDVAGWRRERMPEMPDEAGFKIAPDWLCEVLSPSTTRIDRGRKLPIYAAQGVGHLWLIDPIARQLEVYARQGTQWLLLGTHGDDDKVRIPPFDAIELELGLWWLPPPSGGAAAEPLLTWTVADAP